MLNRKWMWLGLVALCYFILACNGGGGSGGSGISSGEITGSGSGSNDQPIVTALEITPTNASIAKGTTQDLTATGILSDSTHQDLTTSVTWSSSDVGIATISDGVVTATGVGVTTITATFGNVSSSMTLTVTNAVLVSIEVTPTAPSIALGTSQQFTATGTYSDNTTQNLTTTVTWSSSNTAAATISNAAGSEGSASSVAIGATTITATRDGIYGTSDLTVTNAVLVSIEVTPTKPDIQKDNTLQLIATATFPDGTTQDFTTIVIWSSSNTDKVTISNAGLATAIDFGLSTITATYGSISGETKVQVTH